jgi:hypothetical protein
MWTAVPPAKSSALRLLAIQPPTEFSPMKPLKENTQCATGKYTTVTQMTTNSVQPQNFARSAMAPEISAGVMIANISWNMTNARTGSPSEPGQATAGDVSVAATANPASLPKVFSRPAKWKLPSNPPKASSPKDIVNP